MLARGIYDFRLPETPPITGNAVQDVQSLSNHVSAVKREILNLLRFLNQPGVLSISGADGSFETLSTGGLVATTATLSAVSAGPLAATTLEAGQLALTDGITAPVTVGGIAQIYVDTADGDLKVKFGDGVTKTLATDT